MEEKAFDFDGKTLAEAKEILREGYGALGVEITDEQLDHWESLKTATITGQGSTEITVSADLLYTMYSVINQMLEEMAELESMTGKLPFDGSCACPKHSLMLPAFNEIVQHMNDMDLGLDDLSGEFRATLDLIQKKQFKVMLDASERIGVSKDEPYKSKNPIRDAEEGEDHGVFMLGVSEGPDETPQPEEGD